MQSHTLLRNQNSHRLQEHSTVHKSSDCRRKSLARWLIQPTSFLMTSLPTSESVFTSAIRSSMEKEPRPTKLMSLFLGSLSYLARIRERRMSGFIFSKISGAERDVAS